MDDLTKMAEMRGYRIVIEADPVCWEQGLSVDPGDARFSLLPIAGGVAVMAGESVADIGEWLTARWPIGSFCLKPGPYKASCGHREVMMEAGKPFPPCPRVGCGAISWEPIREPVGF